jgi:hypothetical protein
MAEFTFEQKCKSPQSMILLKSTTQEELREESREKWQILPGLHSAHAAP